eukprot:CAMPEP_0113473836 /NCGR_PEP_ID=MMETSP0014_2-20120614/18256_1 /TAXON_ID=2857 /ORGANISM="Nitzschia sp." /LENGTH=291 /DNA_ID=CAMNT_0000366629 /DNA_START=463 /DNA_END=1334 /DNA_ORIENTATION=+ /assembly_acc=CAM_ASM_000159
MTSITTTKPPSPSLFLEEEEEETEEESQYLDSFHMFGISPPPSPTHPYSPLTPEGKEEEPTDDPEELLFETGSSEETTSSSRRLVRFNPVATTHDSSTTYSSLQDRKSRWYTRTELHAMKQAAVHLAKYSHHMILMSEQQEGQSSSSSSSSSQRPPQRPQRQMPRGLEGCTVERFKHKAMTIKCVVMTYKKASRQYRDTTKSGGDGNHDHHHHHHNDDETELYVSQMSMKLSKWNTDLAFLQGCRDYFESYSPELLAGIPTVQSIGPPPQINLVPKRSSSSSSTQQQEQGR